MAVSITLKQLNYALAVEKTRHFKKAAEMCSVSQSALSTAITELENQLGTQIFERDNKKVLVTALGEQILKKAHLIKVEVDDLYQLAQSHKSPLSYPMTLGVIPTIGPYLLPKVLPAVRQAYPDLQLSIVEEQSHVLVEQVRNGEIDTAILALPFDIEGLLAFEFWEENFYVVMHPSFELTKQKSIDADNLRDYPLLLLKDGHCLKDHALSACKFESKEVDSSLAGTSLNTLIQMAAGKMGTTLVPEMAIDQLVTQSSEIAVRKLSEPGPHRRIAFITRVNYAGVNNIEILKKIFQEQLSKHCKAK